MDGANFGFAQRFSSSVRTKVLLAFVFGVAFIAGSALYGLHSVRSGLASIKQANETLIAHEMDALRLKVDFKRQVQEWKDTLLRGDEPELLAKYWNAFQEREGAVSRNAERLAEEVQDPDARSLLRQFVAAHRDMGTKYRSALLEFKQAKFDPRVGDLAVRGIDRQPADLLEQAYRRIHEQAAQTLGQTQARASRVLMWTALSMAAFVLVAAVLVSGMLLKIVVRPLVDAARIANSVADGDLTVEVEVKSNDEAGRLLAALAKMRDRLAQAVTAIRRSAESVSAASKQIAGSNAELSARTEQEASSIEETAASMEELTVTVKQNGEHAKRAKGFALEASVTATSGGEAMQKVVTTMEEILSSSKKIAEIIGVIDSIAFQTNILALNAAVEAARAGEQGRGFAVVASEVRSLAQRSAAAAKEIRDLIAESASKVNAGSHEVNEAGRTMEAIVASAKKVTDLIAEIYAAGREQSQGIEQVNQTITQLEKVTQQNAAMVEQASAAAGRLEQESLLLTSAAAVFRLGGAAVEAAPVRAPAPRRPAASPALKEGWQTF